MLVSKNLLVETNCKQRKVIKAEHTFVTLVKVNKIVFSARNVVNGMETCVYRRKTENYEDVRIIQLNRMCLCYHFARKEINEEIEFVFVQLENRCFLR